MNSDRISNTPLRGLALWIGVVTACLLMSIPAQAQIYVSPAGNDTWPGTIDSPYVTIQRAVTAVSAGGLIYLRGGIYLSATGVSLNKNGTSGLPIRLWAYPGETPVLDFSPQPRGSSSRGVTMANVYWHLRALTIHSAGDNGIYITGSNNIVEACILHDNEDTGLQISGGGSNNLVLNCDSYANYDSATHGENADGFAPKLNIGPGNLFRCCRAWDNADDGWDIFEGQNQVLIDSCWAFHNGYNLWGDPSWQGDGNGFKLGGNFIAASHTVTRSVAFDNRSKGFDQNNNTAGQNIYNCTGYQNLSRNFSFPTAPAAGTHVLKNNIGFTGSNALVAGTVEVTNSWQGFTVTSGDFQSLDTSLATAPRQPDGSLPATALFRLAAGSSLIDAGTEIGLPFNGTAPDLGAYETTMPLPGMVALSEPADNALDLPLGPTLRWFTAASAATYRIQVAEDSLFSVVVTDHPVLPDTLRTVSGLQAARTYFWRVRAANTSGDGPWSVVRRFTTVTSFTGQFAYDPDWNLVSLPLVVSDPSRWAVFPTAVSVAYRYSPDNGYVEEDTLHPGAAYWLKFPSDQTATINGLLRTHDTLQVAGGWAMIGSLSVPLPVSSISEDPSGIVDGSFYGFAGSYAVVDTLLPGHGYWVKTTTPGTLILFQEPWRAGATARETDRTATPGSP